MNQFIQYDAFSSLKSFSQQRDIYSSKFGEDLEPATFRLKAFGDDCPSMIGAKEHQYLMYNVEDELPKFHFPPKTMELLSVYGTRKSEIKSTECMETDSIRSQTSTRANFTKENSSIEDESNQISLTYFDDMSGSDKLSEPEEISPREHLPTLDQIFNLKSNPNFGTPSTNFNKYYTMAGAKPVTGVDANKQVAILTTFEKLNKAKLDLSKRGDVVNKTILRAMKRYYFTEFDSMFNFTTLNDKDKFANFHQLIRRFVTKEMKGTRNLSAQDQEEAILFFGSMISHVHMRRGITVSKIRTQVNFVHKCLYNYSHKKLSQLMENEGFKFILDDFVNYDGIEVVLNSEETMLKQQDLYRDACRSLLLKAQE